MHVGVRISYVYSRMNIHISNIHVNIHMYTDTPYAPVDNDTAGVCRVNRCVGCENTHTM